MIASPQLAEVDQEITPLVDLRDVSCYASGSHVPAMPRLDALLLAHGLITARQLQEAWDI